MKDEDVILGLKKILEKARAEGLSETDLNTYLLDQGYLPADKKSDAISLEETSAYTRSFSLLNSLIFKWYPIFFAFCLLLYPLYKLTTGSPCLVNEVSPFGEIVTPLVDCRICEGVTGAPRLTNLSQDEFVKTYAYNGKPILVEGAVLHWSAIKVFSYEYFKDLYLSAPSSLEEDGNRGQFFSYSSNIQDLNHLFSLPDDVANMATEKWYIGWSTADEEIGESLKEHVGVPPFIPRSIAEDMSMSWIFMGSPGPGANLHIDMVELPSWQAQLKGKKTWTLVPPPECEAVCHSFNVTMNTGDVIVVDTNKWYHKTYIHPGSISITIGSEYT